MAKTVRIKSEITDYLLGRLSDEAALDYEVDLFADEDLYLLHEAAKQDLITAYLVGRLQGDDLARFEEIFVKTPAGQKEIEFARALHQVTGEYLKSRTAPQSEEVKEAATPLAVPPSVSGDLIARSPQPPVAVTPSITAAVSGGWRSFMQAAQFRWVAACLCLLVGALAWMLWRNAELRSQLNQEQNARTLLEKNAAAQAQQIETLTQGEDELRKQLLDWANNFAGAEDPRQPTVLSVVLTAFFSAFEKGGSGATAPVQKLEIPNDLALLRLRLEGVELDRDLRYHVSLFRLTGAARQKVWEQTNLKLGAAATSRLALKVPAKLLKAGDYLVLLSRIEDDGNKIGVGEYHLNVSRK